ncbi:MAG: helix-turn-helix transcriptional regulator [Alphaproteobacteria bacterium]|nr:helix-turn-helix transcriptional regulator [Alphaproteobacteria bacterium]
MLYKTLPPPAHLEPFVDCLWILVAAKDDGDPESQIVVPDGKTELIVHFGDAFLKLEGDAFERQARVLMSGQLTERIMLKPTGAVGVVSIRFKAAGAARFFDVPYEEIVDRVVDFADFEPAFSAAIHDRIARAGSHDERLATMAAVLDERLTQESKEDIFVRQACQYIVRSEGEYSVQDLVKLIGLSERQLERKFKKQVGLAPKVLSRIMRFQKFLAMTKEANTLTLADAAAACGYYDQSHFIRDFTKFSGMSPMKYLSSSHVMSDHFTTPTSSPTSTK